MGAVVLRGIGDIGAEEGNAGSCNHRRYLPELIDIVASGRTALSPDVTQGLVDEVIDAYEAFDRREPGWAKVALATS